MNAPDIMLIIPKIDDNVCGGKRLLMSLSAPPGGRKPFTDVMRHDLWISMM